MGDPNKDVVYTFFALRALSGLHGCAGFMNEVRKRSNSALLRCKKFKGEREPNSGGVATSFSQLWR